MQGQDAARPLAVHGGAGVARGGQCQQIVRQGEARTDHRDRLERLEGRAREGRRRGLTGAEEDAAVGVGRREASVVHALDRAAAGLEGQRDVGGQRVRGQDGRVQGGSR